MSRDFLTTDDILEIHNVLVEQYGGTAGIRDMSGLEDLLPKQQQRDSSFFFAHNKSDIINIISNKTIYYN